MDFCDVSVRVLYDFEYTTKYGRNIKIAAGERLLLIKKTNNDWWQVIRSSEQRPFFVPAAYVEEIEAKHSKVNIDQSKTKHSDKTHQEKYVAPKKPFIGEISRTSPDDDIKCQLDLNSESTATSGVENHQLESDIKKENNYSSKVKLVSSTMSSSGYNSLCEEIPVFDEEASYVTVHDVGYKSQVKSSSFDSGNTQTSPDNGQDDVTVDLPASDSELSVGRDSCSNTPNCEMLEDKPDDANDGGNSSNVTNSSTFISEVGNPRIIGSLPATDSLENLTLQIELKTSSLRNNSNTGIKYCDVSSLKPKIYSVSADTVNKKSVSSENCNVSPFEETVKAPRSNAYFNSSQNTSKESRSSENVCGNFNSSVDNNSLRYQGSFKSNTERQRWFNKSSSEKRLRNVVSCSEDSSNTTCFEELNNTKSPSAANKDKREKACTQNVEEVKIPGKVHEAVQKSERKEKVQPIKQFYFGSDSQLSRLKTAREKTTSRHSLDSVVECELKDSCAEDSDKRKYNNKEFSTLGNQQTNSEKSSTDSLLEIENDIKCRKISGGTTSDSLVPTDGEDLVSTESEADSVKLTRSKQNLKNNGNNSRKIPLARRRRVFTSKSRLDLPQDPLSPPPNQEPTRTLGEGWNEYNTDDGRKYFYNVKTKEKRWKPPRRNNVETKIEDDPSTRAVDTDDMYVVNLPLPSGWRSDIDTGSGQTCYINIASNAKWFSSTDNEGRVYFFEENSNKSSWTLPDNQNDNSDINVSHEDENSSLSNITTIEKSLNRNVKSKSMILSNRYEEPPSLTSSTHNWPQLWEGTMCVLKEGPLNKTKITENGKRVRKNWTSTHAVLTELLLLFFKDNKGFPSMMSGNGRPELSVDLNGAVVDTGDKVSSRKNVYMLSTVLGLQVLIQCDCAASAELWLAAIQGAINNLPSSTEPKGLRVKTESPSEESKPGARINRSKSMKLKQKSASIEDLSVNMAERQTKIKERLKKFFIRRPTVDLLVKKGIWKDEPVFGCLLEHACPTDPPRVPLFVQHCIRCIERTEENMKTDGLYRASGNLSQVQKIRLQVDQNVYSLLEQEEDVHVLAGTLKLFFRELKQPLIPFKFFNKAIKASTNPSRSEKLKDFRDIVKSLPPCNHDTLNLLLQHLLRVTQYHEFNRMHIPNIAIVFGPTLMWPEQESLDMAFDLMQQNLVIECFLSDFHSIF
uniref:Rho GTPase-activating protein 12 n=1 Tax=Graphocephala atropunctata TaxID=36148 RepID=A0A1B6LTH6_9HEMI